MAIGPEARLPSSVWMRRPLLPLVRRDLGDQLLEDGLAERLVVLGGDHEGAGAADHAVVVVAVEIGLEREDRQAVDADAGGNRLVACERHWTASIVGAVAGHIDHPPRRPKRALGKQCGRIVDGAADRGAAAEQLTRGALDRGGESGRALLVADQR